MESQVSALLLAAGRSRRMGRPKQVLPVHGKPFIRHCLDGLRDSGIRDIVVVLGAYCDQVIPLIADLSVQVAFNGGPDADMAESVRIGLRTVGPEVSGVLVCLCDHPLVAPETYRRLVEAHRLNPTRILIPTFQERRGHPTLFSKGLIERTFEGLNLREIIKQNADAVELVAGCDPGILVNIDTMVDYRQVCEGPGREYTERA